jgi:hypothetical protein
VRVRVGSVVAPVAAPLLPGARRLQPEVAIDPVLVLRRYVAVVVEGRGSLDRLLVGRDLDELAPVVHPDELYRDQGGLGAEKAHLDADVLGLVVLVHEQVVHLADLLVVLVVDRVILVCFCRSLAHLNLRFYSPFGPCLPLPLGPETRGF